jgi:hypothetical protein
MATLLKRVPQSITWSTPTFADVEDQVEVADGLNAILNASGQRRQLVLRRRSRRRHGIVGAISVYSMGCRI